MNTGPVKWDADEHPNEGIKSWIHIPLVIIIATLGLFQSVRSIKDRAPLISPVEKQAAAAALNPIHETLLADEVKKRVIENSGKKNAAATHVRIPASGRPTKPRSIR